MAAPQARRAGVYSSYILIAALLLLLFETADATEATSSRRGVDRAYLRLTAPPLLKSPTFAHFPTARRLLCSYCFIDSPTRAHFPPQGAGRAAVGGRRARAGGGGEARGRPRAIPAGSFFNNLPFFTSRLLPEFPLSFFYFLQARLDPPAKY